MEKIVAELKSAVSNISSLACGRIRRRRLTPCPLLQPESVAFQKPVSKRDAPDYYESELSEPCPSRHKTNHPATLLHKTRSLTLPPVIKHPMDLASVLKNVKSHRYRSKADFVRDLDLIWDNCVRYNFEVGPLSAVRSPLLLPSIPPRRSTQKLTRSRDIPCVPPRG